MNKHAWIYACLTLTLTLAGCGDSGGNDEVGDTETDTTDADTTDTTTDATDTTDTTDATDTTTDTTDTTDTGTDTTDTGTDTTDTGTDTTDTGGLSFEVDVFPIISASCSCHVGGAGGLAMPSAAAAYGNLVGVPAVQDPNLNRVEPGDPDNSYFMQKIAGTQAGISPTNAQMPKNTNPLSAGDQMLISDWIAEGAAP